MGLIRGGRAAGQDAASVSPARAEQEGIETLVQGPIHEAFANPAELNPTPGPIVKRQPPQDVKEEPPEFMPAGATWIAGYWVWDDERNDFIWVTGVARKAPPGMQFVPGYWTQVEGGWQRVAGFWINANAAELEYREAPPESVENGPSSPAPGDNYFWIPGSWSYYDTGYRWRAGYWSPYQPDWIWCPARWVWTPAGFVYSAGYWDYEMSLRGQIFSPLYFQTAYYTQPGWAYQPWCVIPTNNLFIHLWIRPQYGYYYFGNYYGPQYAAWQLQSWSNLPTKYYFVDPFANYCRVHYRRQGIDYLARCQSWHNYYVQHADQRPPRTWHEQQLQPWDRKGNAALQTQLVARNLSEVARRDDGPLHLSHLDNADRRALAERVEKLHELNTRRVKVEHEAERVVVGPPHGGGEASGLNGAGRDAARSALDLARAKLEAGEARLGPFDGATKRGSLLEQAEAAIAAKGKNGHEHAGSAARLALPKAAEVSVTPAGERKALSSAEKIAVGHRDAVPPPLGGAKSGPAKTDAPASNAVPTITQNNAAKAALLKDKAARSESLKVEVPAVVAPGGWIMPSLHREKLRQGLASEPLTATAGLTPQGETGVKSRQHASHGEGATPRFDVPRNTQAAPRFDILRDSHAAGTSTAPNASLPSVSRFESSNTVAPRLAMPQDAGGTSPSFTPPTLGNHLHPKNN